MKGSHEQDDQETDVGGFEHMIEARQEFSPNITDLAGSKNAEELFASFLFVISFPFPMIPISEFSNHIMPSVH